jgi:hypothetical protein
MFGGAGIGYSLFGKPQWMFPPGYNSKEATRRVARQFSDPNSSAGSPFANATTGRGSNGASVAESQIDFRTGVWQEQKIDVEATRKQIFETFPQVERSLQVICGTPKSVIPKIRKVLEVLRPGIFGFWQNDGPISAEARTTNIRLIAEEVLPATREIGKELGLQSPFDVQPGSRKLPASGVPESVGSLAPLAS